jgi:hypothetical protein
MATAADVRTQFPELSGVDDATVSRWFAFAQLKHNAAAWGCKSDLGLICLTAHLVELARRRASGAMAAFAVQSRSVEGVSTTFAVPQAGGLEESALAATSYGQLYLDLRSGVFGDRVLK